MSMLAKAAVLCVSMCFASIAPSILRGHDSVAARPSPIDLEATIPREFGAWRERAMTAQVVNPQSKEMIDMLYSQVLTRTYVDDRGNGIMLTIAYGGDQRGNLEVHKPEVCYPAQGFTVHQNVAGELSTPFGTIAVRRLETSLGPRKEPVTYWTTLGNSVIEGRLQKRIAEFSVVLSGQVPDGLLVRVSSIDPSAPHGWEVQNQFVDALVSALRQGDRQRFAGLGKR